MKHSLSVSILAAGLLLLAPAAQGQDCSTWSSGAMRGTYAFSGSAWQDLSVMNPALPSGYAPVSIVGAFTIHTSGDVTGWGAVNAGGIHMTVEFVNSTAGAPKADCSIAISLSMKMNELGGIDGPHAYTGVIAGDVSAPEIVFMMLGTGPGSHVELNRARRISMKFD